MTELPPSPAPSEETSAPPRAIPGAASFSRVKPSHILIGLAAGAGAGALANIFWRGAAGLGIIARDITDPAGEVWLRSLIMIVIPLVFAVLSSGVADLGDIRRLGRIGAKTLLFFVLGSAFSGAVGLILVDAFHPGGGLPLETRNRLMELYRPAASSASGVSAQSTLSIQTLVNIVPRNPVAAAAKGDMLAVIFFSLIFGLALGRLPAEGARPIKNALRALGEVMTVIIDLVMRLAPYGVFALMFSAVSRFGMDLLIRLFWYVLIVVAGLAVIQFGAFPAFLKGLAARDPIQFFRGARVAMLTAFSTASSIATLPTTLRVSEAELKLSADIGGFVLPLGAAMNKIGSALFESATIVFIAQVLGIPLGWGAQGVVIVMTVLTAGVGNAGIPSAIIPLMIPALDAVGVPGEGIALIIGVDRLLDMFRTAVNVTGNMVAAAWVAKSELPRGL